VITAVTAASATTLNVTFNDRATTEYGFQYERKIGTGGTYALVLQGGALQGAQSGWFWPDGGLTPGTQYCYRIRAFDATVASAYSNEMCGTTQAGGGLLAPSNVSITVGDSTTLNVNFNDNATNETGFDYERKTGTGGTYQVVLRGGALPGAQAGWWWPNGGLQPGTTYCYRIRATTAGAASPYSNEACGTTSGSSGGLAAPSGVSISRGSTGTLNVIFNDNATTETGFDYERAVGTSGTFTVVLSGNALPGAQAGWYWPNSGLQPGTTYCYRIRAKNGNTFSAYSNTACGTAP
jgi:titin